MRLSGSVKFFCALGSGSSDGGAAGLPQSARNCARYAKPHHENQGRLSPGGNPQAAVDATAQVVSPTASTRSRAIEHQLAPMADAIEANLGKKPTQLSAGTGAFAPTPTLSDGGTRDRRLYRARAGQARRGGRRRRRPPSPPCAERQRQRRSSPYRLRKQLPEPVFGQIKPARGFPSATQSGVEKVANEWGLGSASPTIS